MKQTLLTAIKFLVELRAHPFPVDRDKLTEVIEDVARAAYEDQLWAGVPSQYVMCYTTAPGEGQHTFVYMPHHRHSMRTDDNVMAEIAGIRLEIPFSEVTRDVFLLASRERTSTKKMRYKLTPAGGIHRNAEVVINILGTRYPARVTIKEDRGYEIRIHCDVNMHGTVTKRFIVLKANQRIPMRIS